MYITIGNLSLKVWLVAAVGLSLFVWLIGRWRYRLSRDGTKVNRRLRSVWIVMVVLFATIGMIWIVCVSEKQWIASLINDYHDHFNEHNSNPLSLMFVAALPFLGVLTWFSGVAFFAATGKYLKLAKKADRKIRTQTQPL